MMKDDDGLFSFRSACLLDRFYVNHQIILTMTLLLHLTYSSYICQVQQAVHKPMIVTFFAGEGEVAVDESLFQDLDDLELEDEYDEDFVPGDDEGLSD